MDVFEFYGSLAGIGFVIGFIIRDIIEWDINEEDDS